MKKETKSNVITILLMAVLVYVALSSFVYAFRHPEKTDTQRLLNIGDALRWK